MWTRDLVRRDPELDKIVLTWTIDEIVTPTRFVEQVGIIPMEFRSVQQYLRAFQVPLLEEVRAQLHQALEKTMTAQSASKVVPVICRRIVITRTARGTGTSEKILDLHFGHSRSNMGVKTSELILLFSREPRWDARRERLVKSDGMHFVLASVIKAEENSAQFLASVFVEDGSRVLTELKNSSRWHAVLPGVSLTPAGRIWEAISEKFVSDKDSQDSIMHTILRIDRQVFPTVMNHSLLLPQTEEGAKIMALVEDYNNSRGLNESQRDVVKSALAALLAGSAAKPHVRVVQGPPGTGKTAMLVTLISVLGCLQRRTLISAPTNAAVIELSKRMMRFFEITKNEETFFGFCSRADGGSKHCIPISWSDVVLILGNEEILKTAVDGTLLEKIFLPYRILRLNKALYSKSGWKSTVHSVERFLTKAPELYAAKLEEESGRRCSKSEHCKSTRAKEKKQVARNASFWRFARESMVELQSQMQISSVVLTTKLPPCHINKRTRKAMISASNLMTKLVNLMPSEAPNDATSWFTATDILSEAFTGLNLHSENTISTQKMKFLQEREALLAALKSGPGCLLATYEHLEGSASSTDWLRAECLGNATLVFSTVSGAGSPGMKDATFELAIIDEASQLVEAEATIITRVDGLKQLILVGDHKQLPATVISKVAENCGYKRSLFDRLQTLQHGYRHMLNIQYRMQPPISRFPSSEFYEGKLRDGPNVSSPTYGSSLKGAMALGAYAFLDCKRGAEVPRWKNPQEVKVVTRLVAALGKVCAARRMLKLSVGVISPYAMQVKALEEALRQEALPEALQVQVKTVDGFQGNERDAIIFSAVRSNHSKKIGFVDDFRRLNVAITRGATLSGGSKIWKKLVEDAKARKCFHVLEDEHLCFA